MQSFRQALIGLATGALSTVLILGILFVVLAEGDRTAPAPTAAPIPVTETSAVSSAIIPTISFATLPSNQIPSPALEGVTPIPPTASPTFLPAATQCPPPMGWVPINVAPAESLELIALRYQTTAQILRDINCLSSDSLVTGSVLYVPYVPLPSATACRPPAAWIRYTVQPGDTLYRISVLYRVTVDELQRGNCMGYQTLIAAGEILYVPNVTPSTLTFTPVTPITNTPTPSETPVPTNSPVSLSETPIPATDTSTPEVTP
jgi:LysM repeat protein